MSGDGDFRVNIACKWRNPDLMDPIAVLALDAELEPYYHDMRDAGYRLTAVEHEDGSICVSMVNDDDYEIDCAQGARGPDVRKALEKMMRAEAWLHEPRGMKAGRGDG